MRLLSLISTESIWADSDPFFYKNFGKFLSTIDFEKKLCYNTPWIYGIDEESMVAFSFPESRRLLKARH